MGVVLITGCSSGFGMLAAVRLAGGGHTVYATMRNMEKKGDLLAEAERHGVDIHLLRLDVVDDISISECINQIESDEGELHVVINNAGYGIAGFFEDLTENEVKEQFETNFFGVQKVIRHSLPLMRKSSETGGKCKIINISSVAGRSPVPGLSAYTASKFALEGFSESLYHELQPFGIQVVLVEPGAYSTKIFTENSQRAEGIGRDGSVYTDYSMRFQERVKRLMKSKEMRDPEEVAALIEKIVNSDSPKLRYLIGSQVRLRSFFRWILPSPKYSSLLRKAMFGKTD